jgi:hypothetical protein
VVDTVGCIVGCSCEGSVGADGRSILDDRHEPLRPHERHLELALGHELDISFSSDTDGTAETGAYFSFHARFRQDTFASTLRSTARSDE